MIQYNDTIQYNENTMQYNCIVSRWLSLVAYKLYYVTKYKCSAITGPYSYVLAFIATKTDPHY